MSSILLKKDYEGQKAGLVISVPWAEGKTMIATGIGEWYDSVKSGPPANASVPKERVIHEQMPITQAVSPRTANKPPPRDEKPADPVEPPHDVSPFVQKHDVPKFGDKNK